MRNFTKVILCCAVMVISFSAAGERAFAQAPNMDKCVNQVTGPMGGNGVQPRTAGDFTKDMEDSLASAAADNAALYADGAEKVPKLDLKNAYCLGTIMDAYNTALTFLNSSSIVGAITGQVIRQVFAQITQNCTALAGQVSSLITAGASYLQVCMPVPNVKIGSIPSTSWPSQPCNGVAVIGVTPDPLTTNPPTAYGPLWGLTNPRKQQ